MQVPNIRTERTVHQSERAALIDLAKAEYAAFRSTQPGFLFAYLTHIEMKAAEAYAKAADPYLKLHIALLKDAMTMQKFDPNFVYIWCAVTRDADEQSDARAQLWAAHLQHTPLAEQFASEYVFRYSLAYTNARYHLMELQEYFRNFCRYQVETELAAYEDVRKGFETSMT